MRFSTRRRARAWKASRPMSANSWNRRDSVCCKNRLVPPAIWPPDPAQRLRLPAPNKSTGVYTFFGGVELAAGLGLEPRQTDPESVVLPLHHPANGGRDYNPRRAASQESAATEPAAPCKKPQAHAGPVVQRSAYYGADWPHSSLVFASVAAGHSGGRDTAFVPPVPPR